MEWIQCKANWKREAAASPDRLDVHWGGERDELRVPLGLTQPSGTVQSLRKEEGRGRDAKFCL